MAGSHGLTVEDVLGHFVAELDDAQQLARRSKPFDDSKLLTLVEQMVVGCTQVLLDTLGEPGSQEESPKELITRASEAIRKHPDRFVGDAALVVFERRLDGLHQVLRDVDYLRKGLGMATGVAQPADMKWDTAAMAASYTINTFRRIAAGLESELAEVRLLAPAAKLDLTRTRSGIVELLRQAPDPDVFMNAAIDLGASQTDSAGWDEFRSLPYDVELNRRSSFFLDVVSRHPPRTPLAGLYAEIAYASRGGKTIPDLDVTGSDTYEPDAEDWFASINYTPRHAYAGSEVLAKIYELACTPGGLGNAADYTLCLAWGAYLARACAYRYLAETHSDRIGLRVGFSGGDWIELGWVHPA